MKTNSRHFQLRSLFLSGGLLLLSACGWVDAGSGIAPNDPEPSGGQIVAQAELTPLAGVTISGSVTIYDMSGGTYIIRISGLVAPAENGLVIIPIVNGSGVTSLALRTNTGTQNYTVQSSQSSPRWEQVKIHSSPNNRDYAAALFDLG
ncbi:MAG: hypothetical protein A2X94_09855 [Bdellovibrionales bacterium GWB1_55_8]|nr:MAG: hypothetical protein A2X94_09855 [Bdellovibrionales bacterium GWB1_55_8]